MGERQDAELFKQLRFKLLNNNIYFRVFKDLVFENSDLPIKAGADLIVSGINMKTTSDVFSFVCIYREKIEDDAKEDDNFGIVQTDLYDLIKKLKNKEISAYYVNKRSPDTEIQTLVNWN